MGSIWMVLSLIACGAADKDTGAPATEDTGLPCAEVLGALTGEVLEEVDPGVFSPMPNAKVSAGQVEGAAFETLSDAEGRFSFPLEAGDYVVSATNGDETCFTSEPLTVTVTACETAEASLLMDLWIGR